MTFFTLFMWKPYNKLKNFSEICRMIVHCTYKL